MTTFARSPAGAWLRERPELLALGGVIAVTGLLPGAIPGGVYGLGLVAGGGLALQALGLVLVYRANRIINFAQVQMGALAGMLYVQLEAREQPLEWVDAACGCIDDPAAASSGWQYASAAFSVVVSLLAVAIVTWVGYHLVVKRFATAPRLVLTLVTVALAEVFSLARLGVADAFGDTNFSGRAPLPTTASIEVSGVAFAQHDLARLGIAVLVVAALVVFFRRSPTGVVLRGAADNGPRAATLGVDVNALTSRMWVVAAVLSGIVSILDGMAVGVAASDAGFGPILRILAAAVIAAMVSLPITVVAALAIGVLDQTVLFSLSSAAVADGVLLLVVVGVLLAQRQRRGRADTESFAAWAADREVRPIPAVLRQLPVVARWIRWGTAVVVGVTLALPWLLSPSQTKLASVSVTYAIVALSLLVLTGWAGQISLGQFAFSAVGAWTAGITGAPFPLSLVLGAGAGAAAAVVVGLPALRLRGLHLAISTLAFASAVTAILLNPRYLAKSLPSVIDRPRLLGIDLADERAFFYTAVVVLLVVLAAVAGMRRGRTARALIACRDNEPAAQAYGINIVRARLGAFAISGAVAAVAGVLFAYSQNGVNAAAFGPGASIRVFLLAVIGGLGTLAGPLIGAAYFGIVTLFSSSPIVQQVATGIGTILLMLAMPGGLSQAAVAARDAGLRRVADRYRIAVPSLIADGSAGDDDARVPIAARSQGFVPDRYRLEGQWSADRHRPPVDEPEDDEFVLLSDGALRGG